MPGRTPEEAPPSPFSSPRSRGKCPQHRQSLTPPAPSKAPGLQSYAWAKRSPVPATDFFRFRHPEMSIQGKSGLQNGKIRGGDERQKEAPQRGSAENRPFAKRAKRHRQPVSMPHQRPAKCSFWTRECPFFAPKMPRKHRFLPAGRNRKKPQTRYKRHLRQPLHI